MSVTRSLCGRAQRGGAGFPHRLLWRTFDELLYFDRLEAVLLRLGFRAVLLLLGLFFALYEFPHGVERSEFGLNFQDIVFSQAELMLIVDPAEWKASLRRHARLVILRLNVLAHLVALRW